MNTWWYPIRAGSSSDYSGEHGVSSRGKVNVPPYWSNLIGVCIIEVSGSKWLKDYSDERKFTKKSRNPLT